jgi:hypothetical protein
MNGAENTSPQSSDSTPSPRDLVPSAQEREQVQDDLKAWLREKTEEGQRSGGNVAGVKLNLHFRPAGEGLFGKPKPKKKAQQDGELSSNGGRASADLCRRPLLPTPPSPTTQLSLVGNEFDAIPSHKDLAKSRPQPSVHSSSAPVFVTSEHHISATTDHGFRVDFFRESILPPTPYSQSQKALDDRDGSSANINEDPVSAILPRVENKTQLLSGSRADKSNLIDFDGTGNDSERDVAFVSKAGGDLSQSGISKRDSGVLVDTRDTDTGDRQDYASMANPATSKQNLLRILQQVGRYSSSSLQNSATTLTSSSACQPTSKLSSSSSQSSAANTSSLLSQSGAASSLSSSLSSSSSSSALTMKSGFELSSSYSAQKTMTASGDASSAASMPIQRTGSASQPVSLNSSVSESSSGMSKPTKGISSGGGKSLMAMLGVSGTPQERTMKFAKDTSKV